MSVSRIGSARSLSPSIQRSTPIRGFTPCRSASRWNFTIANRLPWSVRATAGMAAPATACMSRGTRTMPSTSEYSVCNRRWTNAGLPARTEGVGMRGSLPSHGRKTVPVEPAGPDSLETRQMVFGGIALVALEAIFGVERRHACHEGVAAGLGQDRRSADLADSGVPCDHGLEFTVEAQHGSFGTPIPVHLDASRRDGEPEQRAPQDRKSVVQGT